MYYCQPQQILLTSSVDVVCFDPADHPQALKHMTLNTQVKMQVDILRICEISQILQVITNFM
jgi:hypothetical protein